MDDLKNKFENVGSQFRLVWDILFFNNSILLMVMCVKATAFPKVSKQDKRTTWK